ncbi:hypothetical protein GDO81_014676 [Engystomops pustulosus]|uniref:Uncharacterized protein n=1 Tax=Engystomops pustulosus TaxID=76066 RepID=A0AAV7BC19_ENGPU|nr:hypothetical protein GDO81_014676 [Engystomops pustulosus]
MRLQITMSVVLVLAVLCGLEPAVTTANPIIIKPCNGTSCVPRCRPCPPGRFCPAVCIEES